MEQRQSPSFLDQMYTKYNLQDPEANKFSLVPQLYILRGIQRADNPEPQNWGFGNPIDVANLVFFLSSEDSAYITGQNFHINGGMLMV